MALFVVGGPARVAEGFQQILDATRPTSSSWFRRPTTGGRRESFRIAAS
jgi:hypothetical protein